MWKIMGIITLPLKPYLPLPAPVYSFGNIKIEVDPAEISTQ